MRALLAGTLLQLLTAASFAQSSNLLGEAAGSYLGSAYLVQAALNTSCKSVAPKLDPDALIRTANSEIFPSFDSVQRAEIEKMIPRMQKDSQGILEKISSSLSAIHDDENTNCGLLVGYLLGANITQKISWQSKRGIRQPNSRQVGANTEDFAISIVGKTTNSGRYDTVGFSRLLSYSEAESCSWDRLSGNIVHLNREANGVRVDGFALEDNGSRTYVNVNYSRLSSADGPKLTNLFERQRRVSTTVYRCGAAGRMVMLDEIVFKEAKANEK